MRKAVVSAVLLVGALWIASVLRSDRHDLRGPAPAAASAAEAEREAFAAREKASGAASRARDPMAEAEESCRDGAGESADGPQADFLKDVVATFPAAREHLGLPEEGAGVPEADSAAPPAGWSLPATPVTVQFASRYSEGWTIEAEGTVLRQTLLGGAPSVRFKEQGVSVYRDVMNGVDALLVRRGDGAEEFLRIAPHAASSIVYQVAIESSGGAFRSGERLEVVDAEGRTILGLGNVAYWRAGDAIDRADAESGPRPLASRVTLVDARTARLEIEIPAHERGNEILLDPSWTAAISLASARYDHTATLLGNGRVLVTGGVNSAGYLASCEVYDPVARRWSAAGTLPSARSRHTATLLQDGTVLIVGGTNGSGSLASCAIYNPATNAVVSTSAMPSGRNRHSATLMGSGRVLVAGGDNGGVLSSCVVYNPAASASTRWSSTGSMATRRMRHTATLLPDNTVLVAGGLTSASTATRGCEIFASGRWTATGSLITARGLHASAFNGKVLVAGGSSGAGPLASCELFDLTTRTWSARGSLTSARDRLTATLLSNGRALVAGGMGSSPSAACELYDFATGSAAATNALPSGRYYHTATPLKDGTVLVAGGTNGTPLNSCALYALDPAAPPTSSANDPFGIRKIYPTASGGREYYMNAGATSVSQLEDGGRMARFNSSVSYRSDDGGYFRVNGSDIRFVMTTPSGAAPWKNVEMTMEVRMISGNLIQPYARGEEHSTDRTRNWRGSANKSRIWFDADARVGFMKELYHESGNSGYGQGNQAVRYITRNGSRVGSLMNRWVRFKYMCYNVAGDRQAKMEVWVDLDRTNDWRKVTEYVDDGGWHARPEFASYMSFMRSNYASYVPQRPRIGRDIASDEVITWPGQFVSWRSDGATWDFRKLSCREIQAP